MITEFVATVHSLPCTYTYAFNSNCKPFGVSCRKIDTHHYCRISSSHQHEWDTVVLHWGSSGLERDLNGSPTCFSHLALSVSRCCTLLNHYVSSVSHGHKSYNTWITGPRIPLWTHLHLHTVCGVHSIQVLTQYKHILFSLFKLTILNIRKNHEGCLEHAWSYNELYMH